MGFPAPQYSQSVPCNLPKSSGEVLWRAQCFFNSICIIYCADLPSPAQLFLSRCIRTFLPELKNRMTPSVCRGIKAVLTKRRKESKAYYKCNAHTLPPLQQGQTAQDLDKLPIIQSPASHHNSYVVTSQGRQYIRN